MIDLRSDTVTRPTAEMLDAMRNAPLGDDVYGEDPTVNRLEERVASELGKESALFTPTGTMANQIAVRLHCRPGEELICEATSHVVLWEGGAPAALSGVSIHPLAGRNGLLTLGQLHAALRPDDIHSVQSRLLWLENTHNRGGGTIQSLPSILEMTHWAKSKGLACHLDGARLWNAEAATGIPLRTWAQPFDTVNVCFSKGLGAPSGSALVGSKELIRMARRYRKLMGGAMRQVGMIAAGCLYALDHHREGLKLDHENAQILADAVRQTPGLRLIPETVETNLVWMEVDPEWGTPQAVAAQLRAQGILISALGENTLRACTHRDVSTADCHRAAEALRRLMPMAS